MRDLGTVYRGQAEPPEGGEHWSGPAEMVDRIAARLRTESRHLVLDVGCGVGGPARRLVDLRGCRVVALDLLPAVVAIAARRSRGRRGLAFAAAAADALPIVDGAVDQVWSLGVVAHLPDVRRFAEEVARVVRGGGSAAVTEGFWDGRRPPRFAASSPVPWRPVTAAELVSALREAGLDEVRAEPWPGLDVPGALEVDDAALRADLRDGRIVPAMVIGTKP